MANKAPATATKKFYQFQSVYPIMDAKGSIQSYRVIMNGKIANVPANGHIIRPNDPHYPLPKEGGAANANPENYKPAVSEISTLGSQRRECLCDLIAVNRLCREADNIVKEQAGNYNPEHRPPWGLRDRDGWKELSKEAYTTPSPRDEFCSNLGTMSFQGYLALQKHQKEGATLHPQTNDSLQKSAHMFHSLLKNDYALAMAPDLVNTLHRQAQLEAALFVGKSPREKEGLALTYPLGSLQITAPLRESDQKKLERLPRVHEVLHSLGPIDIDPEKLKGTWGNEVISSGANDRTLPFLTRAAQIQHATEIQRLVKSEPMTGVRTTAPLPYPPAGPSIINFGDKLRESKDVPKIIPVQIVGEPEYSTLEVDSSKGFVRRMSEDNGRKMVALKEVDGVIQIPHEARYRFDKAFGRSFDQESPQDKYSMLQVIASGGEASASIVNAGWQKMSDNQKTVLEGLKMATADTGVTRAIKSDAFSKFRETMGREFDAQSGLDKINLANISSGKPQVSIDAWIRNSVEPAGEAIPTLEVFDPAPETSLPPERTQAPEIAQAPNITEVANSVSSPKVELEADAPPQAPADEDPAKEELDEEERRKRTNAGQALGDYMDTSVDIF